MVGTPSIALTAGALTPRPVSPPEQTMAAQVTQRGVESGAHSGPGACAGWVGVERRTAVEVYRSISNPFIVFNDVFDDCI